ncbi:MAG: hypothetical protein HFJ02_04605 [Bacilli bacterium]|nr:hypothetical protein [Bacilli bacterium]
MNKKIVMISLLGLLLIFCAIFLTKKAPKDLKTEESMVTLSPGFEEIDFKNQNLYKNQETLKEIEFFSSQKNGDINIAKVLEDGTLEIQIKNEKPFIISIEGEKIIGISSDWGCGYVNIIRHLYILTENNNVYKSSLIYNKEQDSYVNNSLKKEFEKIFDGSDLKNDKVSLVRLNSENKFSTCLELIEVYLKIGDKVVDFNGKDYKEVIPNRAFLIGDEDTLIYEFSGIIKTKNKVLKNTNNEPIEFIICSGDGTYLIDKDENEYILEKKIYDLMNDDSFNGVVIPSNKIKILKIGKKGLSYEFIFDNNTKKKINIDAQWSLFEEIV